MRCTIALMQHETNTFSPLPTTLQSFASVVGLTEPPSGEEALSLYGHADFAFSAMVRKARQLGADISIPIAAYAEPGGKVTDDAFDFIAGSICEDVAKGCDAVLLDLHGAMVTETYFDGEGELLKRIRSIDPDVPIAVALDFHTNLTEAMTSNCTVIDGYRTYPHIDMVETGERAAKTLFTLMAEGTKSRIRWKSLPMMTHMILQTPSRQPMKDIMDRAIKAVEDGLVLNASVFGGFPLADIPHVSFSTLTVESEAGANGERIVDDLCSMGWQRRVEFVYEPAAYTDSIHYAGTLNEYPVVIADHGDNCGAGGSADDLTVLEEMLEQGLDGIVAGPIWDPVAVDSVLKAGKGASIALWIGGKTDVPAIGQVGRGVYVEGKVSEITDGIFTITCPMQTGLEVNLGRTVVLETPRMKLVVCEERWEPYDTGCFTHAGIDPVNAKYILVKSRQHFRAGFEGIARHIVLAAGPGVCSSDYSQFEFNNLVRPIFPLDPDTPEPLQV